MKKVLIVDDEPVICGLIKRSLESTGGYDVSVCTISREAVRVVKIQRPDIILVDVNMPELSGPELVRQLRNDEITQNIPCIYMGGNLGPAEEQEDPTALSIAKPFKKPQLIALIEKVLKQG